jgi:predicted DNA-binding transcriptional regulator AlpA
MPIFQLIISFNGLDIEDFEQLEALETHLPDAYVSVIDGQHRVNALIAANSAVEASYKVVQATREAIPESRSIGAQLELLAISDIANMVGLNRETIRLWTTGQRGPGGFPDPLSTVGDRIKVWTASAVYTWLRDKNIPCPETRPLSPEDVVDVNRNLAARRIMAIKPCAVVAFDQWLVSRSTRAVVPVVESAPFFRTSVL